MTYPEFQAFHERSVASQRRAGDAPNTEDEASDPAQATPEDRIDAALKEIDVALREALLDRIRAGTPAFFERLVIELLTRMGYGGSRAEAAQHLGGPGDGGVDGVIKLDPLGLDVVYIQAKKNGADNAVSRPTVQGFAGALDTHGATRGVFITTSYFTADAEACARAIRTKQIVLIDGDRLADLLIAHDVAVREDRRMIIKKLDEDFFEE
jgi:restriction system protein